MTALRAPLILRLMFVLSLALAGVQPGVAQTNAALQQAIAAYAAKDPTLAAFYKSRNYAPIWVGKSQKNKKRAKTFLNDAAKAGDHGLPVERYNAAALSTVLKSARSALDMGRVEIQMSQAFGQYARDVQSGILTPTRIDGGISRNAPRRDPVATLVAFSKSSPSGFMKALPPKTDQYAGLLDEKQRLEKVIGRGGWGQTVPGADLKPGQSSNSVAILTARLARMGYGKKSGSAYNKGVQQTVAEFQRDHGLLPDGIAGKGTLAEVNRPASYRLQQVIVALERERWMNRTLGKRHVLVNIPDYTAKVIDNGRVTYETRAVVGKNQSTHRTPEFSDVMEFVVVNPTWNVPRSITTKEYLPKLQQDPNAVSHLTLIDNNGNAVSRASVNFAAYNASNFPYRLKEPPSEGNALGRVKFMFPNQHNIYLHDTPSKSLFARETRAYSHGCIRLADPIDFAHVVLERETSNPKGEMQKRLTSGRENTVQLSKPIPVHIVYRTAFVQPKDKTQFRRDVYGRDAKVFDQLTRAGVSLRAARS